MRRLALAGLLLVLGGCTWSNSLYQARRLSSAAAKAEREERSFDAGSLWGQVAVKADTAYARNPEGDRGAEALWLRGRALARLGDCPGALPVLERALVATGASDWDGALRLELARCRSLADDQAGALELLLPLAESEDDDLRTDARQLAGRAMVRAGQWDDALELLATDESRDGRWERAMALAELGRATEALAVVAPRIEMADSSADWDRLVRVTARVSPGAVDRLLAELGRMPNVGPARRGQWLLVAAQAGMTGDEAAAVRRLETLLAMDSVPAASQARMLLIDRRFATVRDSASLAAAVEALGALVRGDASAVFYAEGLARWGRTILGDLAETPPGTAEGDLAMYFSTGIARDTLRAPALAGWLLQRLERGWPESPYVPKALFARLTLGSDSAAALRARLEQHGDSPYLAYVRGEVDPRFIALEDSLAFYLESRVIDLQAGGGQDVN